MSNEESAIPKMHFIPISKPNAGIHTVWTIVLFGLVNRLLGWSVFYEGLMAGSTPTKAVRGERGRRGVTWFTG